MINENDIQTQSQNGAQLNRDGTGIADAKQMSMPELISAFLFSAVALSALLIVRNALFYYESFDYIHSLGRWVSQYREMSFWEGLGVKVGNYNPPYMYFLNIFARLNISDLYLIKYLTVIFDAVLAYFVMKLVSLKTKSVNMHILAFLLAFSVPTVIINSSMWGQCDSIYTAFAVGAFYFALTSRSRTAFAFIALALSFKLQAAFIMPIFAVFVIKKKLQLQDIWVFFAVYLGMLFPAFLAGYPIEDLLFVYLKQTNTYHYLTLNAVNIWQFFQNVEFANFKTVGLYAAGVAVLGLLYFAYVHRKELENTVDFVRLAFLFAIIMPFLLPQMHDRFFYMPDILALVLFLYDKRRWFVPVICVFGSFLAYAWLVMEYIHIFDYKIAALAIAAVIFVVLRDLVVSLTSRPLTVPATRS